MMHAGDCDDEAGRRVEGGHTYTEKAEKMSDQTDCQKSIGATAVLFRKMYAW